jgi:glycerol-3-phosphate dehydrogenase
VRPTLYDWGKSPDGLSREHQVVDHAAHGAPGLYSMIGGKLASYRLFSEEMTDVLARRLGIEQASRTHVTPLPGGEELIDPISLAEDAGIEPIAGARLEYRHGARATRIVERIARNPREAAVVCPCEPVLEAEVRYVVAHEWAQTVDDVARRTRLGVGSCGGMRCAARCGAIVAEMTGRSPLDGRRMALDFLETAARRRLSVVGPMQAQQEALSLAALRSQLGSTRAIEGPTGDLGPTGLGPRAAEPPAALPALHPTRGIPA